MDLTLRRLRFLYPVALAAVPVLSIAARFAGYYRLDDALEVVAFAAAATACALAVLFLALRRHVPPGAIAAIALTGVVCFYLFPRILAAVALVAPDASARPATGVLALAGAGVTVWLLRRRPALETFSSVMSLMAVLLVGWLGGRIAIHQIRASHAQRHSELAHTLERPIPTTAPARTPRDIYLIILDGYANDEVLHEVFGYDNSRFTDSLRALGFRIPTSVRSNYPFTALSLPSLLNFEYLTPLAEELGPRETDQSLPMYLAENNRAVDFVKRHGYRFAFFPSAWFPPTQQNRHADFEFRAWSGINLRRALMASDFRRKFAKSTLLTLFYPSSLRSDVELFTRSFAGLEHVVRPDRPSFVFAHFLVPHAPYLLDHGCRLVRDAGWIRIGSPEDRAGYIGQIECVNTKTLELVTALRNRPGPPPIILLQGDHGSWARDPFAHPDAPPTQAAARERFGAFGAYYLPDGGESAFPDSVTLVNVLRYVFAYYLGAALPPKPDSLFFSYPDRRPYTFYPVDGQYRASVPPVERRVARRGAL
jgi:hypothetical protein